MLPAHTMYLILLDYFKISLFHRLANSPALDCVQADSMNFI